MLPRMSVEEAALFLSFVQNSRDYVEFGTGGSTVLASKHVKNSILSVEFFPAMAGSSERRMRFESNKARTDFYRYRSNRRLGFSNRCLHQVALAGLSLRNLENTP